MASERVAGMSVYAIKHLTGGHVYVGCTGNFKQRWWCHRSELRARRHHCKALQTAWDTDGEAAFSFDVLVATADVARMLEIEQEHIDRYRRDTPELLYNTRPFAHRNQKGTKRTHCVHGHRLDDANIYLSKNGNRHCRECKRLYWVRRNKMPDRIAKNRAYRSTERAKARNRANHKLRYSPEEWRLYTRQQQRRTKGLPLDMPYRQHPRGERSHAAKLTDAQVSEIRRRLDAGERGLHLAAEYGVSKQLVSLLKLGKCRP